jgi:hypothetical protein
MGNRLSWLLASQTFLFTALILGVKNTNITIELDNSADTAINIFNAVSAIRLHSLFFPILPLLGIIVSLLIVIGTWAAILRISSLKKNEIYLIDQLLKNPTYKNSFTKKILLIHYLGLFPAIFMPVSFVVIWYFIIDPNLIIIDLFPGSVSNIKAIMTIILSILAFGLGMLLAVCLIDKAIDPSASNKKIYIIVKIIPVIISVIILISVIIFFFHDLLIVCILLLAFIVPYLFLFFTGYWLIKDKDEVNSALLRCSYDHLTFIK